MKDVIGLCLRLVALLLLLGLPGPQQARAQDGTGAPVDWSGNWETRWRDGGAFVTLQQEGTQVTGVYPLYEGRIEAEARGRELRGRWIEPNRSGAFVFVQSRDGSSFTGRFGSGEWWTGARSGGARDHGHTIDQSSPMATMESFLRAANSATEGNLAAIGAAAAVVRPADGTEIVENRFAHARGMFALINQTTFRLWSLPREAGPGTTEATAVLEQAGTGRQVLITFRRDGDRWYLIAPTLSELQSLRDGLRAARAETGGAAPEGPGPHSPRDAMRRFLTSYGQSPDGTDPQTRSTLNLGERIGVIRNHEAQVLASYLKRVIDRAGYVIWQEIPDDPTGTLPYVHFEHPEGTIVIAPYETPEGQVWQFAPETLRSIRDLYTAMEDMPPAPGLDPVADSDVHFVIRSALRGVSPALLDPLGALERWQWAALAVVAALALGAGRVVRIGTRALARRRKRLSGVSAPIAAAILGSAAHAVAAGLILLLAVWGLGLPQGLTDLMVRSAVILIVAGLFLIGWQGIGTAADRYRAAGKVAGHNLILLSLLAGVLRAVLLIASVLLVAHMLSIPFAGVLAGFGIGGVAFALAVQPTLQNLLSGFTLFADRPVSVGETCRFGDKLGVVESIGLRSTRLRTMDRTVISVPNSQFLDMELENYSRRDRFLFNIVLQLRYETTPDQMRHVLIELRKLLIAHPAVVPEPLRVRLAGFGAHSLDIEVFSYVLASDMDTFAAMREDLLLRMMTLVDAAGAQFAFPSVTCYQGTDQPADPDRVREAEAEIARLRDTEDLPFPDFEWQTKAELSDSLDYPPYGSVLARRG